MRTTKDPETRREDILKAALGIFREMDFEKTSVGSIARAAGIAKGSFYNYFESKERVYEVVVSDIAAQTVSTAKGILSEQGLSPKERLQKYIEWTFDLAAKQKKNLSRVLGKDSNGSQRKIYQAALDEGIIQMTPLFADLLQEGMDSKDFSFHNAAYLAAFMMGGFRGIHVFFHNSQLGVGVDLGREYLYELLSRLLGTGFNVK